MLSPGAAESEAALTTNFMSPNLLTGLGRSVIRTHGDMAESIIAGKEYLVPVIAPYHEKYLQEARDKLSALGESDRARMDEIFGRLPFAGWLATNLGLDEQPSIIANLVARDEHDRYIVGDQQFVHFLELNNHTLAQQQREMDMQADALKSAFTEKVLEFAANGWLPQAACENLTRLDETTILVDDGMRTTVKKRIGYVQSMTDNTYEIFLSPDIRREPGRTTTHELLHVLEGEDEAAQEEDAIFKPKSSMGLNRVFGGELAGTALGEAVIEHLTDSMHEGEIEVLGVLADVRSKAKYFRERCLLQTLAERGVEAIPLQLFTAAHFESQAQAKLLGEESAQALLKDALRRAFPFIDVVEELSGLTAGLGVDPADVIFDYHNQLRDRASAYVLEEQQRCYSAWFKEKFQTSSATSDGVEIPACQSRQTRLY